MIMTLIFYRHFHFRIEPGFVVEPDPLITLRPKHGLRLQVEIRRPLTPLAPAAAISAHEAA